jgi:hypothetical protein
MLRSPAPLLFKESSFYLGVIDQIESATLAHEYSFVGDDVFLRWTQTDQFDLATLNKILSSELIDKSHLAAVSALIRTKRWAEAVCVMYTADNYLGWASAARGLIESAGDIVDSLLQIPFSLAEHHKAISTGLGGNASTVRYRFTEIEEQLDHFVFAKWMRVPRGQTNILKAKDNAVYISNIERVMPNALAYYQRLCSITHPSNASIDYLYQDRTREGGTFKLAASNDLSAIKLTCDEFPDALQTAMMMSCNAPLLILRALHKFKIHPKLPALRKMKWEAIKGWPAIEHALRS